MLYLWESASERQSEHVYLVTQEPMPPSASCACSQEPSGLPGACTIKSRTFVRH